jgi:tripartite ATP-independent transporter DctP family solute receptor
MKHYLLGAVSAFALMGAAHAQESLVIGHSLSPTSHYGVGAQAFLDTLEELSGGTFTGEQAPAGQLGGERDMIEGLQIGSLDLVITSTGPLGNFVPEVLAIDLPFLFRDYDHARTVLDGEIGQELLDAIGENDLVGLAWTENGFRHVTNSQRPITSPEDLGGLKLRTMENAVHMAAFEGMGAAPTPMAFPEVFGALQQGVVDGQENPITVITASRFWEVQDYVTLTGHVYSPAVVLASPILFDSLTEEQQGWFREAALASAAATRAEVDRLEAEGVALMRENGMEVITEIDRAPFQELAAEAAWPVYTDQFGNELLERILAVE